jgi:GAF domain-containing protein
VRKATPVVAPAPVPKRHDTAEADRIEQVDHPSQPISGPIGRSRSAAPVEEVLSELFERTQDAFGLEREEGLAFLLDLALEKIPAESGSVFVADFSSNDLALAQARGPKSAELKRLDLRMPVGVGIVGFCAQEAVSLAISDTQKDPRFYKNVSKKLGYDTRSILCAPMVSDGRTFGCLEVINKKGTSHFTDSELAILAYVAHQGAKYLEQTGA